LAFAPKVTEVLLGIDAQKILEMRDSSQPDTARIYGFLIG